MARRMLRLRALLAALVCALVVAAAAVAQSGGPPAPPPPPRPPAPLPPPVPPPTTGPGPSLALGVPWCGTLARGVLLPTATSSHFTWDLTLVSGPNPAWRRYGTSRLLSTLRRVAAAHRRARSGRPRVGIADLSLPRGGPFGPSYGGLGHQSHQNGLDADVLYPRRDRREAAPDLPSQVDRAASQELVDRFVAAGAQHVFVGVGLGLRGPRGVVVAVPHHLDHLHVRLWPERPVRAPARCRWQPE